MKVLLDTHLLLWAAAAPQRLPAAVRSILRDRETQPLFSAASIWEVVIKTGLGRADFQVDPQRLRHGFLLHGYEELAITGEHALAVQTLPPRHKDPFDRMLLAQARSESITLLTSDRDLGACCASAMRNRLLAVYGPPCKLM